jgi:hypothetical protein
MAAATGTSVDHLFLGEPQIQPAAEEINKVSRNSSPPKCKPAFSKKSKGGIFGFKK